MMHLLAQPWWYWLLVAAAVVLIRAMFTSLRHDIARTARMTARAAERSDRVAEDFYWHYYRHAELQAAARITGRKYGARIIELMNERDSTTALRAVK